MSTISPMTPLGAEGMAIMISSIPYSWTSAGISSRLPNTGNPNIPIFFFTGLSSTKPTGIILSWYCLCFSSLARVAPASPAPTIRICLPPLDFRVLNSNPLNKRQDKREKPTKKTVIIQCKARTLRGIRKAPSRTLVERIKRFTKVPTVIEETIENSSPILAYCHNRL